MPDILIGRMGEDYIRFGGGSHVAVYAPTESGKSVSISIPNAFAWPGSLVVLDVKGEVFEKTAGHRAAMGQKIYRFDPASDDECSHRWDPFASIDRHSHRRFRQISRQANMLFPEMNTVGSSANNGKFWDDAGRQAFTAVATILAESLSEDLTMEEMTHLFLRLDGHEVLKAKLVRWVREGQRFSRIAVNQLSDFVGEDAKLRGDIRKTVSTRLQTWADPQIAAVTAASDFDLRDLRREPMTIYVTVQPGNIPRLRPLLRLFFDQVINLNTDLMPKQDPTLKVPVLMLMDEIARLGRMDILAQAPQYVRDYGIRMAFIGQSKAQFRSIYGENETDDIFSNVGAEIMFGTADAKLSQEMENRLGDDTVMFTTRNRPRFMAWMNWSKQGESDHPHRRPLMLDQEIMQMDPTKQIIIRPGMPPMLTDRIRWYDDPRFEGLVQPPPTIPKLDIQVEMDDTAGATTIAGGATSK
jgi:type IV secretion system protein VirD4